MKKIVHFKIRYCFIGLLGILILTTLLFMHFGGFHTGEFLNPKEFTQYAQTIEHIEIPENTKIIALGEATHGNVEFQQLKLSVFQQMVENYGVRAFALEGDFGGCEQVNRYIHGGEGTAAQAAEAIGFAIYRTEEIIELISYMRQYNDSAKVGEDLRFYGFDMQRYTYNVQFLSEACHALGVDTKKLESLMHDGDWNSKYDNSTRIETISLIKTELEKKEHSDLAIHFADILLQYCDFQAAMSIHTGSSGSLRDQFMAKNVEWILRQEEQRGNQCIFISGHNSHIGKWGSYDSMGKLLSKELDNGYYAIGTDFYKTRCNLPTRSGKRTNQIFYSHDPLAKTAQMAGLDICWLDFKNIPQDSELSKASLQYNYMGNLGESYSVIMRILPPSYRIFQPPAVLYDSMIYITNATPTKIITSS